MPQDDATRESLTGFVRDVEPRVRHALIAVVEAAREAMADALACA